MCGDHHHRPGSGAEAPWPTGPIFRPAPHRTRPRPGPRQRTRRAFLGEVGKGTLALAILTPAIAACASDGDGDGDPSAGSESGGADPTTDTTAAAPGSSAGTDPTADTAPADEATRLRWARADLGFVSAYVLARGSTAAIVDTGVAGSADAIGDSLATLGLNYDDVDHVVLTHKHGDHAGSIAEVLARASGAAVYAGQADLDDIDAESIVALTGGEDVFGLEMLATPGHTAGHMAVIDHDTGLLVAGDAIFTADGGAIEGPAQFFDDIPTSRRTIKALAEQTFNTLLVGHGDPIEAGADTAVAALAASLP